QAEPTCEATIPNSVTEQPDPLSSAESICEEVVSKPRSLPPPLPPKPSPGTILKRIASLYSLPPATTSKLPDSKKSISTKSLPCPASESRCSSATVARLRSFAPSVPSPLAEQRDSLAGHGRDLVD